MKSNISLIAIVGAGAALLSIFLPLGTLVFSVGKLTDQVGQNTDSVSFLSADLKGLPNVLEGITSLQAVTTTKIESNQTLLRQLNTTQNMMRGEIQRNAEMKLNRIDFFRLYDDLNNRLLYIERQNK